MFKTQRELSVELVQMEILSDVAVGKVPTTVMSFHDLVTFVNPFAYVGFCDELYLKILIEQFEGLDEYSCVPHDMLKFMDDVRSDIHEWICYGGLSTLKAVGQVGQSLITQGPWALHATMSSDLNSLRSITGINRELVATIKHQFCMSEEEALANANVIVASPAVLLALKEIELTLSTHPEFTSRNSKVHFACHLARSAIAMAA